MSILKHCLKFSNFDIHHIIYPMKLVMFNAAFYGSTIDQKLYTYIHTVEVYRNQEIYKDIPDQNSSIIIY